MRKNDDFLSKFGDRVEVIGKDGVMGIMKHTRESINKNYNYQNELFNRGNGRNLTYKPNNGNFRNQEMTNITNILNNTNEYSNYNPSYLSQSYKIKKFNNNIFDNKQNNNFNNIFNFNNNDYTLNMNAYEVNKNRKSISSNNNYRINRQPLIYSYHLNNNKYKIENLPNNIYYNNQEQNEHQIGDNRQNILDNGYKPYTLKDYKKISNEVKLGKLGPNIGTEDWVKKRNRMKKMSEYGNKVIYEGTGCKNKVSESAEERHRRIQEMKALNGKWNIINEYSKSLLLNKDKNNNEQFKRNVNDKLLEEERLIDKQFELDIRDNEEEERMLQQQNNILYQQRLNKMKNLLFK